MRDDFMIIWRSRLGSLPFTGLIAPLFLIVGVGLDFALCARVWSYYGIVTDGREGYVWCYHLCRR